MGSLKGPSFNIIALDLVMLEDRKVGGPKKPGICYDLLNQEQITSTKPEERHQSPASICLPNLDNILFSKRP